MILAPNFLFLHPPAGCFGPRLARARKSADASISRNPLGSMALGRRSIISSLEYGRLPWIFVAKTGERGHVAVAGELVKLPSRRHDPTDIAGDSDPGRPCHLLGDLGGDGDGGGDGDVDDGSEGEEGEDPQPRGRCLHSKARNCPKNLPCSASWKPRVSNSGTSAPRGTW